MKTVSSVELKKAGVVSTLKASLLIEDFKGDWKKVVYLQSGQVGNQDSQALLPGLVSPENGMLCFEVRAQMENQLIVGMDGHATELALPGKNQWKAVTLSANDFKDAELKPLANWNGVKELRFDEAETLRPSRGSKAKPRRLGGQWRGKAPEFRNLRWVAK